MALGNRTETKSEVTSALVPTLTLAQLITLWNDSVNESTLFRKDIIASATPVGAAATIDFADVDNRTITIAVSTTFSFTGLENGDVKYLSITKGLTNGVAFAGATDMTNFQLYVNNNLTSVKYAIYNKNGSIYALAIQETIIPANVGDIFSADPYKFPTAFAISQYRSSFVDVPWNNPSYLAGFSAGANPLQYRVYNGTHLELRGDMLTTSASGIAFNLPLGNRPSGVHYHSFVRQPTSVAVFNIGASVAGDVSALTWSTGGVNNTFNCLIPLN